MSVAHNNIAPVRIGILGCGQIAQADVEMPQPLRAARDHAHQDGVGRRQAPETRSKLRSDGGHRMLARPAGAKLLDDSFGQPHEGCLQIDFLFLDLAERDLGLEQRPGEE